jgi:ligand-binding sensor domain-containing protein
MTTCTCLMQAAGGWIAGPGPEALAGFEVRAVEVAPDGAVWFAVRDRGLARLVEGKVTWIADAGLPTGVADLAMIEGAIWATGLGGASVLGPDGFRREVSFGSLTPRVVFSTARGGAGERWVATSAGAARRLNGAWTVLTAADGLPHAVVHQVIVDPEGVAWILCRNGLARWDGTTLEVVREGLNFRSAVIGPDGRPWFGTTDGVQRRSASGWTRDLAGLTIFPRWVAPDGTVWAGSGEAGVFRYDGSEWRAEALPEAFTGAEVFDVTGAADGTIWVATAVGVAVLRQEASGRSVGA